MIHLFKKKMVAYTGGYYVKENLYFSVEHFTISDKRWSVRISNYNKSILNVNTYFMMVWYNQSGAVLHKLYVGNKFARHFLFQNNNTSLVFSNFHEQK